MDLTNGKNFRYERKFFIPNISKYIVENLILMNPGRFNEVYKQRKVNNIYLDTLNYNYYHENIAGLSNRNKVRMRWYGETY